MFAAAVLLLATPTRPSLRVPPIATIFGIRVGRNGEHRLNHNLGGGGKKHVGGHPDSGQTWQLVSPRSSVDVDGFSITAHEGDVVEGLMWRIESRHTASRVRIARSKGWMGQIFLGMDMKTAVRIAQKRLGTAQIEDGRYTWTQQGYSRPAVLQQDKPYATWRATMAATHGHVSFIQISCD